MEPFGRFRLVKRLAEGGMGEIFLARSASIDGFEKELVIKRIRTDLGNNERFTSMFIDEARVSVSLSHQNLIQVFDFGKAEGCYYLAMEFVDGCDLTNIMDLSEFESDDIPPGVALYIMGEALKGLDYAHNKRDRSGELMGLCHRDISPDNILVSFDGAVKVTDFGIAVAKGVARSQSNTVVGKYPYMSPEQARGEPVDRRSDVFSCGLVLWELLVGEPPYDHDVTKAVMQKIMQGEVERPSKINRNMTRRIDKLLMGALAPRREDRYPNARAFGEAIRELMGRKYGEFDSYALSTFLTERRGELALFDVLDEGPVAAVPEVKAANRSEFETLRTIASAPPDHALDAQLVEVAKIFSQRPSLWEIVRIAELCLEHDNKTSALSAFRVAGVKFAQRGLLAQSLLCAKKMLELQDHRSTEREIGYFTELVGRTDATVLPYLFRSGGRVEELLAEMVTQTASSEAVADTPPLLRHLGGESFAQMAKLSNLRIFTEEQTIVRQGDQGHTMFLVLSGRTVVFITKPDGERLYIASMTAGDFFGENSFFTGQPRNATVESIDPVIALEIDRAMYDRITEGNAEAERILLTFYKERVADWILATSPTFGLLQPHERRQLLDRFELRTFATGQQFITEGDRSEEIYVVKAGTARAYRGGRLLSKMGPGTILGEVAALMDVPRTASVVAGEGFEALQLNCQAFRTLLDRSPKLAERVRHVASERVPTI